MIPRQTISVRAYSPGTVDVHGNPAPAYAAAVPVPVYAIAPRTSEEPDPDRGAVVVGLAVLAPVGTVVGPHDLVDIDGYEFEVDGEDADWTKGPFGWEPGVAFNLKRTEG